MQQFLFAVRTEGSWLEIGSSLSQLVLAVALALGALLLLQLARLLLALPSRCPPKARTE